ncbi:MAG: hypothetical protein JO170_17330 [Verrucomicrobia bacterium]|nr:hypothetical protein [Verrucomicrobiota bacterium]
MGLNTRRVEAVILKGVELRAGDRVKIQPKHYEVLSDVALAGKIGVIQAFEQDAENRVHVALVLDGELPQVASPAHYPGEHFLFTLDEVEPLPS